MPLFFNIMKSGEIMKFIITEKAKTYITKKNIKEIYINPDLDSKEACCGIATVDFDVSTKLVGNKETYRKFSDKDIDIYVNPNFFSFVKDDMEIEISAFGIGSFKKLDIETEINTIER